MPGMVMQFSGLVKRRGRRRETDIFIFDRHRPVRRGHFHPHRKAVQVGCLPHLHRRRLAVSVTVTCSIFTGWPSTVPVPSGVRSILPWNPNGFGPCAATPIASSRPNPTTHPNRCIAPSRCGIPLRGCLDAGEAGSVARYSPAGAGCNAGRGWPNSARTEACRRSM